jgi:crotonobetainyl-CoA:carnitine CoA-transferase CaiB-like acyl-CoA transferase
MNDARSEDARLPLTGIRVVEVAHYVAVPAAGTLLADLGADVVKVEQPPRGEIYRRSRLRYAGYESDFPEFPPFQMDNRGKRSIMLDLARPEARAALLRILDRADVFLTNLLPGRRLKYGLDHETLLARRPVLVMGAISGYGLGGAEADRPAFDYAAYWARTGMMDAMRDEGVPPSLQRPGVGDHAAASNLVCGVLAALRLRDATGRGGYVDVSLLGTGLHILGNDFATALVTRQNPRRHDRRTAPNPLWNSYPVAEGRWLLFVMIDADRYWDRFCGALERPDLRDDPRFADGFERSRNSAALVEEIERTLARRTLAEWTPRLDAADLIWSPVRTLAEAVDDPQARAVGYIRELEHPSAGRFETVAPPLRIEGVPLGARRAASALHADAEAILREAGLSDEEIQRLL